MNKDYIKDIDDIVDARMFKDEILALFYNAFKKAYEERTEISAPTLIDIAIRNGSSFTVANELITSVFNSTIGYAEIKADARLLAMRRFGEQLSAAQNRVDPNASPDVQYQQLVANLEEIKPRAEKKALTIAEISEQYKEDGAESSEPGVPIGFPSIDEKLGGMEKGDVTIIAARPSVGKSAFATQIAVNLSNAGIKVLFINLEMKEKQIFQRLLSMESGVSLIKIRNRDCFMKLEELDRIRKAKSSINKCENLSVISGSMKVSEIRKHCEREEPEVVIIDYLQLITPEGKYRGNRYAEVGEISHSLKAIAMDLNIPVLVLSQLNRVSATKGKEIPAPTMSELRESGDIEQDASQIMLMWNTDNTRKNKALKIEKNRQGETGDFNLFFDGERMKFIEGEENEQVPFESGEEQATPFD